MVNVLRGSFGNVTLSFQPFPTPSSTSRCWTLFPSGSTLTAGLSMGFVDAEGLVGFMDLLPPPGALW